MKKKIIFWAIVALTVIMATIEGATIGLPVANYTVLSICGICLALGLIYMRLSLYKLKPIFWCLCGGLALTAFVIIGGHFANCLPVVIDYLKLGALNSLILTMAFALYVTAVYTASLYLFLFYFCELRGKIQDLK